MSLDHNRYNDVTILAVWKLNFKRKNLLLSISPTFLSLPDPYWTHTINYVYFIGKYLLKACIKVRSVQNLNLEKMKKWLCVMIMTPMSKWWHQYFFWCHHHAIDHINDASIVLTIDLGVSITLCYVLFMQYINNLRYIWDSFRILK